ncbi:MAG: tRNA pseudouridine(55) synthase TruB [Bacilli bacterium]
MNGLIVVNKEKGKTSRNIVNELNIILGTKKIGHTGTLDPIASGVLVCVIGKYTKLVNILVNDTKEYIAEIKLGISTDTLDITGNIISTSIVDITKNDILKVFKYYKKSYLQEVPLYSSVHVNGKRLYDYARSNVEVTSPKRKVTIYNLELISFNKDIVTFKVKVSKGTYIRSLIKDICNKLNIDGTMNNLIRIKQGNFTLEEAYKIEDIKNNNYKLLNIKEFLDYKVIELPDNLINKVLNGNRINNIFNIDNRVIFTYKNKDIAIYEVDKKDLKPLIMF